MYLHDYVKARETLRVDVIPMLISALMPTMDMLHYEYEFQREGVAVDNGARGMDALILTLPDGILPDGYKVRIEFSPVKMTPWKTPDGTLTKGPGF